MHLKNCQLHIAERLSRAGNEMGRMRALPRLPILCLTVQQPGASLVRCVSTAVNQSPADGSVARSIGSSSGPLRLPALCVLALHYFNNGRVRDQLGSSGSADSQKQTEKCGFIDTVPGGRQRGSNGGGGGGGVR